MAESAFGVEHGEVSKALKPLIPKIPKLGGAHRAAGAASMPKPGGALRQFAGGAQMGLRNAAGPQGTKMAAQGAKFGAGARKVGMNRGFQVGAAGGAGLYGGSRVGDKKKLRQYR